MAAKESFTPRRRTDWLETGMPASRSISQARDASGVISLDMVELRIEPERTVTLQNTAQGFRYPHRQDHRHPASDAENFHVGYSAEGP